LPEPERQTDIETDLDVPVHSEILGNRCRGIHNPT